MPHELSANYFPPDRSLGRLRRAMKETDANNGGGTAPSVVDAQGLRVPINRHPLDVSGAGFFSC